MTQQDALPLTSGDTSQALDVVWNALAMVREDQLPEGDENYDAQWDEITTAMAWITEALEQDAEVLENPPPATSVWTEVEIKIFAIRARCQGNWDNPVLKHFGPLQTAQYDILRIIGTHLTQEECATLGAALEDDNE